MTVPVRVGFLLEGYDPYIVRGFVARLLDIPEERLHLDAFSAAGRGWESVLQAVPDFLRKYYGICSQAVVLGVDNDGGLDLTQAGLTEDPSRPRHWNHMGQESAKCRVCRLERTISETRPALDWVHEKSAADWPVLIAVAVETIESWFLEARHIADGEVGRLGQEDMNRMGQKQLFYGRPVPTREDVLEIALPLVRRLTNVQIVRLRGASRSFDFLATQVDAARARILGPTDCWGPGDRGAEIPD